MKFLLSLLLLTGIFFANENFITDEKVEVFLPINWNTEVHYDLKVSIPKGYRSLQTLD